MSEPEHCYKCDHIVTFCECDEPITEAWDALEYFRKENKALREAADKYSENGHFPDCAVNDWDCTCGLAELEIALLEQGE